MQKKARNVSSGHRSDVISDCDDTHSQVLGAKRRSKRQGENRVSLSLEHASKTEETTDRWRIINVSISFSTRATAPTSGSRPVPILSGATTCSFQACSADFGTPDRIVSSPNAPSRRNEIRMAPSLRRSSSNCGGHARGEGDVRGVGSGAGPAFRFFGDDLVGLTIGQPSVREGEIGVGGEIEIEVDGEEDDGDGTESVERVETEAGSSLVEMEVRFGVGVPETTMMRSTLSAFASPTSIVHFELVT